MKAFIGIWILMGLNSLPSIANYWSKDPFLRNEGIQQVMTKNRFEELAQFIHFNDSEKRPARGARNYDRLYKVRPILSGVLNNIQNAYYPGKNISIDEGMVAFRGRVSFLQYMPAKPTKYGIKCWMAADSGNAYVVNFRVYLGREDQAPRIHGLGYDVIMKMARPYLNKFHHLFFDNFFSSTRLVEHLQLQNTYACATVRPNRKDLPVCAKNKLKQPGELVVQQKGMLYFFKQGNVTFSQKITQFYNNSNKMKHDVILLIIHKTGAFGQMSKVELAKRQRSLQRPLQPRHQKSRKADGCRRNRIHRANGNSGTPYQTDARDYDNGFKHSDAA
ncbi:hypothetical protein QZH41_003676 [Actinostola sp. cb2023]|nr:hypothetical protein QZH41_003676 [Actinostola sp. cb2023]